MPRLRSSFLILCFICFNFLSFDASAEEVVAEIININQDQKIVFIDVGRDALAVGDVMYVSGAGHPIYLDVVEVSDVVSKLGLTKNKKFRLPNDNLDDLAIGMKVTRIVSASNAPVAQATLPSVVSASDVASGVPSSVSPIVMPVIDPQLLVKPDITKESIQSLNERIDKMVDINVKLFNALTQCQASQADFQRIIIANTDLKRQLDEANAKTAGAIMDSDKSKKQAEELTNKINALKQRLDHLNTLIQENLK